MSRFPGPSPYDPSYRPISLQQTSANQPLSVQQSSATPQNYASAPSSQQPIYPLDPAPQATYGTNIYQPQYQPLPVQQNSAPPQRYASAPSSQQAIVYPPGSGLQTTYNSNIYQPQYQSPSPQKPSTVPSSFQYSTPLQNPSTVPSNYQYRLQGSFDSAPQPHASSTTYQPISSNYDALTDGSGFAAPAPTNLLPGVPNTVQPDPQPGPTFQTSLPQDAPHFQATGTIEPQKLLATTDRLASVVVQDGEEPQPFSSAKLIASYLSLFPEAENDQGCRVFKYGPRCSSKLLLPLFEHFDFPRYALFPYGFANDFVAEPKFNAGVCRCQRCTEGRPCGHYVLQHHFQFYLFQNTSQALDSMPPKVAADSSSVVISSRSRYVDQELSVASLPNTPSASIGSSWPTGIYKFSASDPTVLRQLNSRMMPSCIRITTVSPD